MQGEQDLLDDIIDVTAPGESTPTLDDLPNLRRHRAQQVGIGYGISLLSGMHQETQGIGAGFRR
jgi:hypothetical protein